MTGQILVLSACSSVDEAERIARHLVESRLAACVTFFPQAKSIYRWQGRIEEASEVVLLVKTGRERWEAVRTAIEHAHSYDVPEVLAVPVEAGSAAYLKWLAASVSDEAAE